MTLLVRNEEDIIEQSLRFHHARGVDSFIVMDNLSTDRTPEIIKSLAKTLDIECVHQPEDTYDQAKWVTQMARWALCGHGADWVINSDADEFWVAASGDLKTELQCVPDTTGTLSVARHNAVVIGETVHLARSHPETSDIFEKVSHNALARIIHEGRLAAAA